MFTVHQPRLTALDPSHPHVINLFFRKSPMGPDEPDERENRAGWNVTHDPIEHGHRTDQFTPRFLNRSAIESLSALPLNVHPQFADRRGTAHLFKTPAAA
jgi:hypothetical protein